MIDSFASLPGLAKDDLNQNKNTVQIKEESLKDIAIIGMAVKMPGAKNLEEFWNNIRNGFDAVGEFPESRRNDIEQFLRSIGTKETDLRYINGSYLKEIDNFDYDFFRITPAEANFIAPNQRLFLETVWEAIEDAGYGGNNLTGTKTGVYVGYSEDDIGIKYRQLFAATGDIPLSDGFLGNTASIISGRISYLLDLGGPSMLVDTACSSSLVALHIACQSLRNREAEYAIVGSVRINLAPLEYQDKFGIESSDGRARSFDDNSDGTGMGEGIVALLLKPLSKSIKDGDQIHAIIKGSAVNHGGRSLGLSAPNVLAQKNLILKAWKNAAVDPETISYLETHGTGTRLGDPIEIDAIQKAFRTYTNKKQFCAIGALKANIGHLGEAAGLAGLVKAVLTLKNKEIPPMIHFDRPNREINFSESPVYVNDRLRHWENSDFPRRCGVSSFGISGTNCHVILEEAPEYKEKRNGTDPGINIFVLSAKSRDVLKQLVRDYKNFIDPGLHEFDIKDVCYTASTGRGHYNYRLALIVKNEKDLKEKLKQLSDTLWEKCNHDEIFYGEYQIVPENKITRENYEITAEEGRKRSRFAELRISEYLKDKNNYDILNEICESYTSGAEIDWKDLYSGEEQVHIVRLPVYPFERKRCWVDSPSIQPFGQSNIAEILLRNDLPAKLSKELHSVLVKCQKYLESAPNGQDEVQVTHVKLKGREDGQYTQTEKDLAIVWKETLGFAEINIYDNFYESGGDSILAAKVASKIRNKLRINVSVSDVLKFPSIIEFAGYVNNRRDDLHLSEEYDFIENPLVALLNEKTEKNIFAFPPISGLGIAYINLANLLQDFSFYSFDYINDNDKIRKYADLIIKIQDKGPYLLLGYSVGGILAFEVAKELSRLGHPISGIILLDSLFLKANYHISPIPTKKQKYLTNEKPYIIWVLFILILKGKYFNFNLKERILSYAGFQLNWKNIGKIGADIYLIKSWGTNEKDINGWRELTEKSFIKYPGYGYHGGMISPRNIKKNTRIIKEILSKIN